MMMCEQKLAAAPVGSHCRLASLPKPAA